MSITVTQCNCGWKIKRTRKGWVHLATDTAGCSKTQQAAPATEVRK